MREEEDEESTALAEAVEARDPGVFRLRGEREAAPPYTHTNRHTHKHKCVRMCGGREKHSIRNNTSHTLERMMKTDRPTDRETEINKQTIDRHIWIEQ